MQWSFRDLVYLRMLLWLRRKGMERTEAADRVRDYRKLIETAASDTTVIRGDGHGVILDGEDVDRATGEGVWVLAVQLMDEHDLLEPIRGETSERLWQPNLCRPSDRTVVSPWVVAGEPCVQNTRIPTASIFALKHGAGAAPR